MDDDATPDVLTALYRVVPNEFVAERNRLAKQLRGEGRRDVATAITALRRPPLADWALNQTVDIDRGAVDAYVATTTAVSAAQRSVLDGNPPSDLRQLLKQMRTDAVAVVAAAGEALAGAALTGVGSTPPELHARLAELATRPVGLEMLAAGVIGSRPLDDDADDPFAAVDTTGRRLLQRKRSTTTASAPVRQAGSAEVVDLGSRREHRAALSAARRAVDAAAAKRDVAERAMAAPHRKLAAAEKAVERAEEQVAAARMKRDDAAAEVAAAQQALDAASDELANAESDLAGIDAR